MTHKALPPKRFSPKRLPDKVFLLSGAADVISGLEPLRLRAASKALTGHSSG